MCKSEFHPHPLLLARECFFLFLSILTPCSPSFTPLSHALLSKVNRRIPSPRPEAPPASPSLVACPPLSLPHLRSSLHHLRSSPHLPFGLTFAPASPSLVACPPLSLPHLRSSPHHLRSSPHLPSDLTSPPASPLVVASPPLRPHLPSSPPYIPSGLTSCHRLTSSRLTSLRPHLRPSPHLPSSALVENPAYARCRDKPFPAYNDMEFLTQNTTVTGRYAFTSAVELPPIIESSSGSSPGEDDTIAGIGMSACNLSSDPFEAGGSGCARYANFDEANTSRSPSPPVMPTTGESGSAHSSGSKRARSPERSNKQAQTASTSGGRKKKVDARTSAFLDIAEQGKEKLGWVRQLCQLEMSKSTDMPSQNQCMQRVYGMTGLSDDDILVLCDAFKEEKNCNAFMSLNGKHARKWVEREIAQQNLIYRPSFSEI
uniref:Uncharacterized protein n=1 Tax=Ananas comosus var. bracteatus TaxID=296719 RepID=A0A6V7PB12_ANACO|nr:unnamed protein product [Ananas comosus var. bracteatus]